MTVARPADGAPLGVNCGEGVALTAVTVDGEPAGVQRAPPEEPPLAAPVATPAAIADAGFYAYWAHKQRRTRPELAIAVPAGPAAEVELRMDFAAPLPAGAGGVVRGGGWAAVGVCGPGTLRNVFPCSEAWSSLWTLEVHVPAELAVVASGKLDAEGPGAQAGWRKFVFASAARTPATSLAIVVGPMEEVGYEALKANSGVDKLGERYTVPTMAFGPRGLGQKVAYTLASALKVQELFGEHLGHPLPVDALRLVFVPADVCLRPFHVGAGVVVLSSELVVDDTIIDQAIESRRALAQALAELWFGQWIVAATDEDQWLVVGMAGHLHGLFLKKFMGANELKYTCWQEMKAIVDEDDGTAPPIGSRVPAEQGGAQFGTAELASSRLLQHKAAAVVRAVERRMGKDTFQKLLQRTVAASVAQGADRVLSTRGFVRDASKVGGVAKAWLEAYVQRWVVGRGVPELTASVCFNKKRHSIEIAIRQEGSEAALTGANASMLSSKEGSGGAGMLPVHVEETGGTVKQSIHVGDQGLVLQEFKVQSKLGTKKKKKDKDKDGKDGDGDVLMQDPDDPLTNAMGPIKYVRVDPEFDWLARVAVVQTEGSWIAQLHDSKDVVAQSQAIEGLAALKPTTFKVVNALTLCLRNRKVFHKVRMDAAIALGLVAGEETDFASVDGLIKYYREVWFDGPRMKANDFTDLPEYFLRGAVPVALALVRDRDGNSPPEALDFLIEVLQNNNNGGNPYTDDNLVAGAIEALGFSKPGAEHVGQMVTIVGRYFDKDAARSSFQNVVSGACVRALAALASTCARDPAAYRAIGPAVARVLNARDHDRSYLGVRRAVMVGSMELSAARGGYRPFLQSLVQFTRAGLPPKLVCDLLDDARALAEILLARLGDAASCDPAHLAFLQQVAMDRAPEVGAGPRLQHKAFEMLQVLGGRPPTLYRATDRDGHALAFARAEEARGPSKVAAAPPPKRPRPKPKAPRPAAGPKITIAAPPKPAGAAGATGVAEAAVPPVTVNAGVLQKRAKPAAPIRRTTLPNGAVLEVDQEVEAKYLNQVSKRKGGRRLIGRRLTGRARDPFPSFLPPISRAGTPGRSSASARRARSTSGSTTGTLPSTSR